MNTNASARVHFNDVMLTDKTITFIHTSKVLLRAGSGSEKPSCHSWEHEESWESPYSLNSSFPGGESPTQSYFIEGALVLESIFDYY